MKISKIIGGFVLTAGLAFAFVSCQKDQNPVFENNSGELQSVTAREEGMPIGCEAEIPDTLAVPEGNKFAFRAYATGVQIWEVMPTTTDPNEVHRFEWVNTAPSADLYIDPNYNNKVGTHYGGPTWAFEQGPFKDEYVVAKKMVAVTVDPTAVPWLLLRAKDYLSSPGNKVTYIQRVCTTGGLAPAITPNASNVGQVEEVPYTATYLFYVSE